MYASESEKKGREGRVMAATLRLTEREQELIRQKAIKVNKMLVNTGRQPLRDSELLHLILAKTIPHLDVVDDEIVVRSSDDPEMVAFSLFDE